jgi:hypothetical protein
MEMSDLVPTCRKGHAMNDANAHVRPDGDRECRACRRAGQLRYLDRPDVRERKRDRNRARMEARYYSEDPQIRFKELGRGVMAARRRRQQRIEESTTAISELVRGGLDQIADRVLAKSIRRAARNDG